MHVTQGVTYILFKSRKTDLNDLIFCYQSCLISRAPFHDLSRSSCLWRSFHKAEKKHRVENTCSGFSTNAPGAKPFAGARAGKQQRDREENLFCPTRSTHFIQKKELGATVTGSKQGSVQNKHRWVSSTWTDLTHLPGVPLMVPAPHSTCNPTETQQCDEQPFSSALTSPGAARRAGHGNSRVGAQKGMDTAYLWQGGAVLLLSVPKSNSFCHGAPSTHSQTPRVVRE